MVFAKKLRCQTRQVLPSASKNPAAQAMRLAGEVLRTVVRGSLPSAAAKAPRLGRHFAAGGRFAE